MPTASPELAALPIARPADCDCMRLSDELRVSAWPLVSAWLSVSDCEWVLLPKEPQDSAVVTVTPSLATLPWLSVFDRLSVSAWLAVSACPCISDSDDMLECPSAD